MASLISTTEKNVLTGIFGDIFDTFQRSITIHKEPKKIIEEINNQKIFRECKIKYDEYFEDLINKTEEIKKLFLQSFANKKLGFPKFGCQTTWFSKAVSSKNSAFQSFSVEKN